MRFYNEHDKVMKKIFVTINEEVVAKHEVGLTIEDIDEILDGMFSGVKKAILDKKEANLPLFGSFRIADTNTVFFDSYRENLRQGETSARAREAAKRDLNNTVRRITGVKLEKKYGNQENKD